ncbi:MAG: glycosyltransferase, partial [Pseudomonadota bacterium]|nr:glycosyltransferase [Pseudomonadota bacterium]
MSQPDTSARPVQLHVIHDLGGGSAKWLQDFAAADSERTNLVLRSFSHDRAAGDGVALFAHPGDEQPLEAWTFSSSIVATAVGHPEYREALDRIVRDKRVDVVLVSSLIGHSLEVLDTGLPTLVVNHDYFPYCPAINIHFNGICRDCDGKRVEQCYAGNPRFNPFVDFLPPERIAVRSRFMELVQRPNVTMVVPTRSVQDNLVRLNGLFRDVRFVTIPHGYGEVLERRPAPEPAVEDRLRVMVFGQLSEAKGLELLEGAIDSLTRFAEVFLVGAREVGELFRSTPHVHLVSHYEMADLPGHVASINPHLALLMSLVPETFSYALSEMWMLGIPVAATRVGAFAERIRDRDNGYLFEPSAGAMAAAVESIDLDRATLAQVRRNIADWKPLAASAMVAEYHRVAPVTAARAVLPPKQMRQGAGAAASAEQALAAQVMVTAGMWKQVKSVHLQMSLINEARIRSEAASKAAAAHAARDREKLVQGIVGLSGEVAERDAGLIDRDARITHLTNELEHRKAVLDVKSAQLDEIYASTSWRASSPIRVLGHAVRKIKTAARVAGWVAREPSALPRRVGKVAEAWRKGGWIESKKALLGLRNDDPTRKDLWTDYRRKFERDVRPRVVERIATMNVRPLIAVLVPTFNTREDVLVQMIESVRSQLYPDWELCIADDCSTEPHVRRLLEQYAKEDGRINVHYGKENRGVSHATNRALELATADYCVLLDHDDLLEDHALFRIAESIVEDDPDLLYSDEILITPDGQTVRRYAYRPAFSLEYLREHPYIVHLVGYRTSLLREIGGFDEKLTISQDYDLILRAAERAKAVVHIPDILYRWRIHGGSAGSGRKQQVMDTSRAVLQRHLERSGAAGAVEEGSRFNLFEARYPLRDGLKVAIIIPTKNHGELLRQCIESIRANAGAAAYDIVVVDHESDDPKTRAYLLSLGDTARVLRYEGTFNFSAINNFAVSKLEEAYSHYLFCNNDIEAFEPGWLERMLELGQQPSVGIVGPMLFYPDRKHIQHAGVCVGMYGAAEHYAKWVRFPDDPIEPELMRVNREVSAVTAACMLMRADAFREVQGFDESIAVGFGDVDLCLRVGERGYRVIMSPHARLVHHESYTRGTSRGNDPHPEDSALFRLKWKPLLRAGDPFYNPGYSNEHTHWPVKQPLHAAFEIRRRIARRDA